MIINEIWSLFDILARRSSEQNQSVAFLAPGREVVTYGELYNRVVGIGKTLRAVGIDPKTPVAIVISNGLDIQIALLAVASFAIASPLNPTLTADEFSRYLGDLNAGALIVGEDENPQAIAAAQAANLTVLRLNCKGSNPYLTGLDGRTYEDKNSLTELDPAQPGDIGFLLPTSGTTDQPKMVPVTHRAFQTLVNAQISELKLDQTLRVINILPMFHLFGVFNLFNALLAGGSMVCTSGFDALKFFDWLDTYQPNLLVGVPAIFPTLVNLANQNEEILGRLHLRYVFSGSATLDPSFISQIEATFNSKLIELYGSSEALLVASQGKPDIPRKLGSVGKATTATLAIMSDKWEVLPPGQSGEVVVHGPTIMSGYWRNPEASALILHNGWFRMGDLGYVDEDGYLFLTGRIKDMINRGGEKIAPGEIDQALMAYTGIAQAAAFAIPHPVLGEVVAAAMVLKPGHQAVNEAELRSFLVERLAYFKIPSKFIFVPELPKNSQGKIERLKLAGFFGLDKLPPTLLPDSESDDKILEGSVERAVFQIWSEVLDQQNFGLDHNFFDLGATSLEAASMVALVQQRFARLITVTDLVKFPTLRHFSLAVRRADPLSQQGGPLQALQAEGTESPLFIVHGAEGYGYHYYDLAKLLAPEIPVYAFTSIGRPGNELLEFNYNRLARIYIEALRQVQPCGPYRLAGHSGGGILALQMAIQLQKQGETVSFLGMFDTPAPARLKWYFPLQKFFMRLSIPYLAWLASALQPEAYAFFTGKVEDGSFSEQRVAKMNWLEATWYLWQYLRKQQGKPMPKVGKLPSKVIRRVPVKYRTLIWNMSELFFFHQALEIIKYLRRHPESMQKSDIRAMVRAAWQGLHTEDLYFYQTRPYSGEVVIFQAGEDSKVILEDWQQIVKGSTHMHKVKGDHGNHVRLPHAVHLSKLLRSFLQKS